MVTWSKRWLPSSRLTSFYGFLDNVCTSNWAPTYNHSVVTTTHVELLYRIDTVTSFNFGRLIFNKVTFFAKSPAQAWSLPFPSLIHQILLSQGVLIINSDRLSGPPNFFIIALHILRLDKRVVDLPIPLPLLLVPQIPLLLQLILLWLMSQQMCSLMSCRLLL